MAGAAAAQAAPAPEKSRPPATTTPPERGNWGSKIDFYLNAFAFAIGLGSTFISLVAWIPGPIIYGAIIGEKCFMYFFRRSISRDT